MPFCIHITSWVWICQMDLFHFTTTSYPMVPCHESSSKVQFRYCVLKSLRYHVYLTSHFVNADKVHNVVSNWGYLVRVGEYFNKSPIFPQYNYVMYLTFTMLSHYNVYCSCYPILIYYGPCISYCSYITDHVKLLTF